MFDRQRAKWTAKSHKREPRYQIVVPAKPAKLTGLILLEALRLLSNHWDDQRCLLRSPSDKIARSNVFSRAPRGRGLAALTRDDLLVLLVDGNSDTDASLRSLRIVSTLELLL